MTFFSSCSGVIILSELTGASEEMSETLLINPNSFQEINDALVRALEMPSSEQKRIIQQIQKRLRKNDIHKWATSFLHQLKDKGKKEKELLTPRVDSGTLQTLRDQYNQATCRLFFLDYDGTLVDFVDNPSDAVPDKKLTRLTQHSADFILAIGDDYTDEFMFRALPSSAHTIKVGKAPTNAEYYVNDTDSVRQLLQSFVANEEEKRLPVHQRLPTSQSIRHYLGGG